MPKPETGSNGSVTRRRCCCPTGRTSRYLALIAAARDKRAGAGTERPKLTWRLRDRHPNDIGVTADGERVTPEWAWGGATGRGMRVCIVDSGVERDHPLVGSVAG